MQIPDIPAPMIATRGDRGGVVITPSWALPICAPSILLSINGDTSGSGSSERHGTGPQSKHLLYLSERGYQGPDPWRPVIRRVVCFDSKREDADHMPSRRYATRSETQTMARPCRLLNVRASASHATSTGDSRLINWAKTLIGRRPANR